MALRASSGKGSRKGVVFFQLWSMISSLANAMSFNDIKLISFCILGKAFHVSSLPGLQSGSSLWGLSAKLPPKRRWRFVRKTVLNGIFAGENI